MGDDYNADMLLQLFTLYMEMTPGERAAKIAETKNAYLDVRAKLGENDPRVRKLRDVIDLIEDFCSELED